jgi:hypothetical protein
MRQIAVPGPHEFDLWIDRFCCGYLKVTTAHTMSELRFLQLLHLADSALPVGAAAHSFGLKALVAENGLEVADLFSSFRSTCKKLAAWKPYLSMLDTTPHLPENGSN